MEGDVETPAGYREGYRLDTSLRQGAVVMFGVFSVVAWVVQRVHPVHRLDKITFLVGCIVVVTCLKLTRELLTVGVFAVLDLQPEASLRLLTVFPTGGYVRCRTLNLALVTPFILVTIALGALYVSADNILLNVLVGFGIAVHCALSVEDAVILFRQLSLPPGAVLSFDTTPEALDVWVFEPAA